VVIALGLSACASGRPAPSSSAGKTIEASNVSLRVHDSGLDRLPRPVRKQAESYIRSAVRPTADSRVKSIGVYGPASRYLLVKASSGDLVQKTAEERKGFYLFVLRGHFACRSCEAPAGNAKPVRGTIETQVWSPTEGSTDSGVGGKLFPAMSRAHRLALVILTS
jgi:hypothetical protein